MQRRKFIAIASSATAVGLAGCSSGSGSGTDTDGSDGGDTDSGSMDGTDSSSMDGTDSGSMDGTESGMSGGTETDSGMMGGTDTESGMSGGTETDSGMTGGTATDSGSGGMDVDVQSPGSPKAVVRAWYTLGQDVSSQQELVEAQNTLLHTESILYPREVQTPTGNQEGTPADVDIQFDGFDFGETSKIENIQQEAPQLMALGEDVRAQLVEEGELTAVPVTVLYSGADAPPEQEVTHYTAKQDGNWRLVQ